MIIIDSNLVIQRKEMLTNDALWVSNILGTSLLEWTDWLLKYDWFLVTDLGTFCYLRKTGKNSGPAQDNAHKHGKNCSKTEFVWTLRRESCFGFAAYGFNSFPAFCKTYWREGKCWALLSRSQQAPTLSWNMMERLEMFANKGHYTWCKDTSGHSRAAETHRGSPETWSLPTGQKWLFYLPSQVDFQ